MRTRIFITTCLALMLLSMSDTARRYPVDLFISPVNRDIRLSGTFGELRTNHFHAGLDIKSKDGTTGEPIVAAADGYISRIKVEEYGYGNVLYLNHPNGYTTVYAHLDRFAPEIREYVKAIQYQQESFEVDLYPEPGELPVQTAQQIGFLGNSGSSGGPHLHYEIRHTRNQKPINPLHFGYAVADKLPPVIQQLIVYELDDTHQVIDARVMQPRAHGGGRYSFDQPITLGSPKMAFAIRTYDGQDGTSNQNGIYGIDCKIDGEPTFAFSFDEISFDHTRYLNAHIDYSQKARSNKFFHRCHTLEGNKLPIYYTGVEQGRVHVNTERMREVTLTVADFSGNQSRLVFGVRRDPSIVSGKRGEEPCLTMADPEQLSVISQPGIQVVWPKGTFYEKTPLNIITSPAVPELTYSPYFDLLPDDAPTHFYFDVLIEGLQVPKAHLDKAFIARCSPRGQIVNCGGKWIGNNLVAGVRQMGTYTIMLDTVPPRIHPIHFGPRMTGWKRMAFRISDQFPARDRARDLTYEARVDGQWILMALDGKTGTLIHEFDGRIPAGEHDFVLRVTDDRGNTREFRRTFTL